MSRTGRWIIWQALAGVLTWSMAGAQQIDADPPDVYVKIHGPVAVSGDFPLSLPELPSGEYEFEARGLGLATSRGHLLRTENGLSIRPWTSALSLVQPPGVAHLVRGDRRGWIHLGAGAASGAFLGLGGTFIAKAQDRIDTARSAIANATTSAELSEAGIDLLAALAEEDDERRVRSLWGAYLGAVWLGAGLEAWLFNPSPSVSTLPGGRSVLAFPRASRWSAVLRSVLVPGGGQRYLGHGTRATTFSVLVACTAAGAILAQDEFLDARRIDLAARRQLDAAVGDAAIREARAIADAAAADRDVWSRIRWILTGTTASIYLWNVVDAFFGGGGAQSHAPPVSVAATPSGVALRLTFDFP